MTFFLKFKNLIQEQKMSTLSKDILLIPLLSLTLTTNIKKIKIIPFANYCIQSEGKWKKAKLNSIKYCKKNKELIKNTKTDKI
jgi:ABC-type enterochelin transport system permease subunit